MIPSIAFVIYNPFVSLGFNGLSGWSLFQIASVADVHLVCYNICSCCTIILINYVVMRFSVGGRNDIHVVNAWPLPSRLLIWTFPLIGKQGSQIDFSTWHFVGYSN